MSAGKLRHQLTFVTVNTVPGASGRPEEKETIVFRPRAEMNYTKASDKEAEGAVITNRTVDGRIRYTTKIADEQQFYFDNRRYRLIGFVPDAKRRYLFISGERDD